MQVPVEGPGRQELYGRSLYDAVGRPDLGAEYAHRRAVRTGLWVASGALIVASVAVSIWAFSESRDCGFYGCRDSTLDNRLWLSGGLLLGGVAFGIGAGAYGPEPVSRGELYQLVRDHNRAVRRAPTGSPDDASAPAQPPKPSWVLAPAIGPHGGGLALGVRF